MNLSTAEQAIHDSGFACGLVFGPFDPPADLSDDDQILWQCGLHAGLAEGLRRKRAWWDAEQDRIFSRGNLGRIAEPLLSPITDADW